MGVAVIEIGGGWVKSAFLRLVRHPAETAVAITPRRTDREEVSLEGAKVHGRRGAVVRQFED
jgi:hypothetical protein